MHIVLVEPEIAGNTGNIARTCAVTGSSLHLVRPLGFETDDKHLKRAGLDYWHLLDLHYYNSFAEIEQIFPTARFFMASTHGTNNYADAHFQKNDFLVFGRETAGLPKNLLKKYESTCIRIPMSKDLRSLNLANSVAIILYEALRQQNFPDLY